MRNTTWTMIITAISLIFIGCAAPEAQPRRVSTDEGSEELSTLSLAEDSDIFMVEDASSSSEENTSPEESMPETDPTLEVIATATAAEAGNCVDKVRTLEPRRWRVARFINTLSDEQLADICADVAEKYAEQIALLKSFQGKTMIAIAARALTANSESDYQGCGKLSVYVLNEETGRFELAHQQDMGTCTDAKSFGVGLAGVLMQAQDENGDTYYKYGTVGLLYGPSGAAVRLRTPAGTSTFAADIN